MILFLCQPFTTATCSGPQFSGSTICSCRIYSWRSTFNQEWWMLRYVSGLRRCRCRRGSFSRYMYSISDQKRAIRCCSFSSRQWFARHFLFSVFAVFCFNHSAITLYRRKIRTLHRTDMFSIHFIFSCSFLHSESASTMLSVLQRCSHQIVPCGCVPLDSVFR